LNYFFNFSICFNHLNKSVVCSRYAVTTSAGYDSTSLKKSSGYRVTILALFILDINSNCLCEKSTFASFDDIVKKKSQCTGRVVSTAGRTTEIIKDISLLRSSKRQNSIFYEGFNNRRGKGKIHICHPQGNNICPSEYGLN
jgi:hypothetical protein